MKHPFKAAYTSTDEQPIRRLAESSAEPKMGACLRRALRTQPRQGSKPCRG
jgi:hypothetical protein